ncbi:hypothetical protein A9Q99_27340 [Gammaproteobacteria bacterium 45_16_T64]|nr:hypothetical protein A9Q99_27340 [Gammaproteobacteria bacterium 45_16_T64]
MSRPLAIVAMDVLINGESGLDRFDQSIYEGQSLVSEQYDAGAIAVTEQTFASFLDGVVSTTDLHKDSVELYLLGEGNVASTNGFKTIRRFDSLALALDNAKLSVAKGSTVMIAAFQGAVNRDDVNAGSLIETLAFDVGVNLTEQVHPKASVAAAIVLSGDVSLNGMAHSYVEGYGSGKEVTDACALAFADASVKASDIEFVDVTGSDTASVNKAELLGLVEVYGQANKELTCALGSSLNNVGECGAVQALVSVVSTSLSLRHHYIPMVSNWEAPADQQAWDNSPFYVATESTPWFENKALGGRKSAVNITSSKESCHIVLAENRALVGRDNKYFSRASWCFYPMAGNSFDQLSSKLRQLQSDIAGAENLKSLAADYFSQHKKDQATSEYSLVVLGESQEVLDNEVELMLAGLKAAFDTGVERKTPKGSFFTPTPVGPDAEVAFVYPGIGAPYVDFGRDLFHLFPKASESLNCMSRDSGKSVKQDLLYPRARHKLSPKQKKQVEKELKVNLHKISECGVGMGYLLTKAFRDQFKLEPNAGVGYSMGEVSMYVALDAWTDPGCLSEPLADHPTFKHNITGELYALKDFWGLAKTDESGTKLWNTYSLRGNPEEVSKVVAGEEKVFLTIINTPDNMLIGGDPEGCQRVVKKLGTRAMSLELASAIHSAPAKAEYDRIVDLYSIDVNERSSVRYYSTSVYKAVPHRTKAIANSIAKSFTEPVDFPRLIQEMVDSGVRVFVEMGADRSCSTWIDKILKHGDDAVPHVCVPVNARGTDDHITIVRALAKLVSHRVNIDISSLYGQ